MQQRVEADGEGVQPVTHRLRQGVGGGNVPEQGEIGHHEQFTPCRGQGRDLTGEVVDGNRRVDHAGVQKVVRPAPDGDELGAASVLVAR